MCAGVLAPPGVAMQGPLPPRSDPGQGGLRATSVALALTGHATEGDRSGARGVSPERAEVSRGAGWARDGESRMKVKRRRVALASWAVLGVVLMLAESVVRLSRFALARIAEGLEPSEWAALVGTTLFMGYVEGYRAFSRSFGPRVVARSFELARAPALLHVVFAPSMRCRSWGTPASRWRGAGRSWQASSRSSSSSGSYRRRGAASWTRRSRSPWRGGSWSSARCGCRAYATSSPESRSPASNVLRTVHRALSRARVEGQRVQSISIGMPTMKDVDESVRSALATLSQPTRLVSARPLRT